MRQPRLKHYFLEFWVQVLELTELRKFRILGSDLMHSYIEWFLLPCVSVYEWSACQFRVSQCNFLFGIGVNA